MKRLFIALIVVLSTACTVGARRDTLPRDRDETEEENVRLRKELARLEQEKRQGRKPANDRTTVVQGADVSTGRMVVRQRHGVYMGAVGVMPRQMTQGRKLEVTNVACDDHARDSGSNCSDRDGNGAADYNTWMAFMIGSEYVDCDIGIYHPRMGIKMLAPEDTCFVETGAARGKVKVKVMLFRNNGDPWSVLDVDTTPFASFTEIVPIANGIETRRFDETYF